MKRLTYKDAGVDIDGAGSLVKSIARLCRKNLRPEVLGRIGGFSGFFRARFRNMKEPVLAASADGVGTKLILADIIGRHDTVGVDLVAMCVNDIIACGAEPLFFLDYLAAGALNKGKMLEVMKGVLKGCSQAGCSLIGGETAELPGLYRNEDYDMAGFCVGVVDKKKIIDGANVSIGDVVLGLASSGPHSNGYSLIRRLFSKGEIKGKFRNILLRPTVIYVKPVLALMKRVKINAIAHITGGGFYDNITRILPRARAVVLNPRSWRVPRIFKIIQKRANADIRDMYRTFNMGIGMILILNRKDLPRAEKMLSGFKMKAYVIGEVVKGRGDVVI